MVTLRSLRSISAKAMDIEKTVALIQETADNDTWVPDEEFSVFNQWDKSYYIADRERFTHKYRVFKAITTVLKPDHIVELGTHGGSGADAYLTGVDYQARYTGYDSFGTAYDENGEPWEPADRCKMLFAARGFNRFNLVTCDLRVTDCVAAGDLAIVDAGHDYRNAYQDLILCARTEPDYIHVDDFPGNGEVHMAVEDFIKNYRDSVDGMAYISHISGSALIRMRYDNI